MKSRKLSFVNIITIIKLFPILLILAVAACSDPSAGGGAGTVKINFSKPSAGREAYDIWPPGEHVVELAHRVIFTGNGRTLTFDFETGKTSGTATVPVGSWNITIKAYWRKTFLYAKGSNDVEVRKGPNPAVEVTMYPAYYKEGDTGPGGGVILAVANGIDGAPFGFTTTYSGEVCHYLEVARDDLTAVSWASPGFISTDIKGLEEGYGTSRKNTALILAADPAAPAALACKNYKVPGYTQTDWYLPSRQELEILCIQWANASRYEDSADYQAFLASIPGFTPLLGSYWSSSQANDHYQAYSYDFDTFANYYMAPSNPRNDNPDIDDIPPNTTDKTALIKVRPMRAFAE